VSDTNALPPAPTKESKDARNLRRGSAVWGLCIFDDFHASWAHRIHRTSPEETARLTAAVPYVTRNYQILQDRWPGALRIAFIRGDFDFSSNRGTDEKFPLL